MPAPDAATPPETFGPYVVYERLGLGGMATVHRAKKQGIAGFERGVALKRMLAHLSEDAQFVESFIREAKVASLLVHPNIAQVYDFGRIDGVYFIAMEHVEGFDVRRILRHANRSGQAIPLGVVLSILMEMCDALEFAHNFRDEHGTPLNIVHRDVSPSNLIVAHTGHLKVIDFGIAKASARTLHTESGQAKGKLGYMSPEVAMGHVLGPVSDVFSAGVVAHELLTAMPLFTAKTDFETMLRIREGEIDPPSRRNPGCPPELDHVVLAALSRDPRTRLPTAGAFRHALDQVAHKYNIRVSAREVVEYMQHVAQEAPRLRSQAESPYSAQYPTVPSGSFGNVGTPGGVPRFEDDLDDWGDSPSSRLNVPIMGPHFTPSNPAMPVYASQSGPAQIPTNLSVSNLFPAHVIATPPVAPAKRKTPIIVVLLLLIAAVGAAIVYVGFVRPDATPAPAAPVATTATLRLVVQPADATVEIGGKPAARDANGEVILEPGVYSIIVKQDGYLPSTSSVSLEAGERKTATIALARDANVVADAGVVAAIVTDAAAQEPEPRTGKSTTRPRPKDRPDLKDPKPTQTGGSAEPVDKTTEKPTEKPIDKPVDNTMEKPTEKPIDKPVDPVKPTPPARTPVVAATSVTKLSGELPAIKGKGESAGQVLAKLCIDTAGRVTEVSIKKLAPDVVTQLQSALRTWRYKPYVDPATKQPSPVCFPLSFKLVFKKSD